MKTSTRIITAFAGGILPVILYSYASGPDPRLTGAPGDQTCTRSGCHTGTALNGGGGSVTLTSSDGATYTPGKTQTLTLVITDSRARVYGFQATARPDSNSSNGQAGNFTAGAQQIVICENGSTKGSAGCPASGPVQFIEHSRPFSTNKIAFSWTPPSGDVGPVTVYVAANAANGNNDDSGDHIYTAKLQLQAAGATTGSSGSAPTIASGGVASAAAFKPAAGAAPGTWIEIFGDNLSTTTRSWATDDFNGGAAPTSLDGVTVTVGGKNAYVDYISPTQVNAQVPDSVQIGSGVAVVVNNSQGASNSYLLNTSDLAPALLAPPQFAVNGKQYVAATMPGAANTFVMPAGAISGVTTRPASAGDVITLYGIGFGPVSPSTPAGTVATQATSLTNRLTVQIGSVPATVTYAGLAPGFVGLYQFNVTVPSLTAGDWPLVVQLNGTQLSQNLYLTTQ